MRNELKALHADLEQLKRASILSKGDIAERAIGRAVAIFTEQDAELATLRARLDMVENRAAAALGRCAELEAGNNGEK